jgi:hypothetical protein
MDENNNENFQFKIPFLCSTIAKRESGKRLLTKYLCNYWYNNNDFDEFYAFTNTNEVNNEYEFLKPKNIINRYDDTILTKLMLLQKKAIKKWGKESKKIKNVLVILDDVIGSFDKNSSTVRELITQGRHYKISLILNIQITKKEISTEFKGNSDYFLIGYNNKSAYYALFEELNFNGNFAEFLNFMNRSVIDYQFVLYINKVIYDQDYNKRYKIIKANNIEELKDFKIK